MTIFYNGVRVYSSTTGTGDIYLGAAVPGFRTLAEAGVQDSETILCGVITYDPTNLRPAHSEQGLYTYHSAANYLTRTTIENSTNGGSAITLTGTSQVALLPSAGWLNGLLNKSAVMWHDQSVKTVGNAFTSSRDTNAPYNTVVYQNTSANGDTWTNGFVIKAGTYALKLMGSTGTGNGKLDCYIDNVNLGTTLDWYASPAVKGSILTISNVVLTDGYHTFKGVVNGKNASSSGYDIILTKIWLEPAAY